MNKKKILIAGGDMRMIYCCLRLEDEFDTFVTGFDEKYLPEKIKTASLNEAGVYDYAVLPVPALDSNGKLSAPCSEKEISPEDIAFSLKDNSIIFAGKVNKQLEDIFKGHQICDYLLQEDFALNNAVPTAEGAVNTALSELPVTLSGLKVLVVGMGRIGTALVNILRGFGSEVHVAVRNAKGAAKVRIAGAYPVCTKNISPEYGLVFNTVPAMIFDRELLAEFSRETLFIDLASKPGGIDFSAASELGIKAVWATGLPGKTAPVTAGEIIAGTVINILSERSGGNG